MPTAYLYIDDDSLKQIISLSNVGFGMVIALSLVCFFVDPDGMAPFNEYIIVVKDGKVQSATVTGTKGGDVNDYIKVVNLDEAPYASGITNYTVDVQPGYTSGPAADDRADS